MSPQPYELKACPKPEKRVKPKKRQLLKRTRMKAVNRKRGAQSFRIGGTRHIPTGCAHSRASFSGLWFKGRRGAMSA